MFLHDALGPKAPPSLEENFELVMKTNPDMVGFSTTTSAFFDGYDMATSFSGFSSARSSMQPSPSPMHR